MITIKINDNNYQLRLTTKSVVDMEAKLGNNPLNIFAAVGESTLPKMKDIMVMFHGCLVTLNHGITLDDAYALYDDYCAQGGNLLKLIQCIVDVFKEAGFIPDSNEKN